MKRIPSLLLILVLCFCSSLQAQEDGSTTSPTPVSETPPLPKQYYLFSPRVAVTVPHPMGNNSFRKAFVGIYELSAGFNIMVHKGIFIGPSYKHGLLRITENKIADYNASMTVDNASVKVGGDMFIGDRNRTIFSASLGVGQSWTNYSGLKTKTPGKLIPEGYITSFIEPELDLYFLVESNFGIGASVSYIIYNKNFDPVELSLNEYQNFDDNRPGLTQYLSFGFGFYYSLVKKKK